MKLVTSHCQECEYKSEEECRECFFSDERYYALDSRFLHICYCTEWGDIFFYLRILGLWIRLSTVGCCVWIETEEIRGLGEVFLPHDRFRTSEED